MRIRWAEFREFASQYGWREAYALTFTDEQRHAIEVCTSFVFMVSVFLVAGWLVTHSTDRVVWPW